MAPRSGPSPSARFPWLIALVAVAFLLGVFVGSGPAEPPAPPPSPSVEIRVDAGSLTLLPDASLRFDAEPKQIEDFQTQPDADSQVDNRQRKR